MTVTRAAIVLVLATTVVVVGATPAVHAQVQGVRGASDAIWLEEKLLSCRADGEIVIDGNFVSEGQETTIRAWATADNEHCHVQHERGPVVRLERWTSLIDWQTCRSATGRDKLMVSRGTGSNGAPVQLEVWDVAGDRPTPTGFERSSGGEFFNGAFPADMVSAAGVCSPRVSRRVVGILKAAAISLFSGVDWYRRGTPGETTVIDYKTIPGEVAQRQLVRLLSAPEHDARVYTATNGADDGRWSVLMVRLTPECGHRAVVLARDRRSGVWKSLLEVPGGTPDYTNCALTNGALPDFYLPHVMAVSGDYLTMGFETGLRWSENAELGLVVDLRTGEAGHLGGNVTGEAPIPISGTEVAALFCEEKPDTCGNMR